MPDNTIRLDRNTPTRDYFDQAASTGQVPPAAALAALPCAADDPDAWRRQAEQHAEQIARTRRAGNNAAARALARDVSTDLAAGIGTPQPATGDDADPDEIAARVWRP